MDKQPPHRRPSWANSKSSYETYMRNDLSRTRSPTTSGDYGMENFSYDDKYIKPFLMPEDLKHEHLPAQVKDHAIDWGYAGAALDTAIERMGKLKGEAWQRGWPDKTHTHLSRGHYSRHSPTVSGAESSQTSSPMSPMALPQSVSPLQEQSVVTVVSPELKYLHQNGMSAKPPMGMESPPFTPVNSQAPTTPANPSEGVRATLPDLQKINTQLTLTPTAIVAKNADAPQVSATAGSPAPALAATPATAVVQGPNQTTIGTGNNTTNVTSPTGTASTSITSPTSTTSPTGTTSTALTSPQSSTSGSPGPAFDENAWETYLNSYKAELKDLQGQNVSRFRGFAHSIQRMQHEYGGTAEYKEIMKPFGAWWETQKPKVKEYEEKVKKVTAPELEEAKKERVAKGLSV